MSGNRFLDRLKTGEPILIAEGYVMEMQRRGHLQAGSYTPEVVLNNPEAVRQLTEEFVACGTDVVLALTYYAQQEKMNEIGRVDDGVALNKAALAIAKKVAEKHGCLFAGNISNNTAFDPESPAAVEKCREQAAQQIALAKETGVDFIVAETYKHSLEAIVALEEILKAGLPAVVNMVNHPTGKTMDGRDHVEVLNDLRQRGAAVVGLNCYVGVAEEHLVANIRRIRAGVSGPISMLPVTYRTGKSCFNNLYLPDGKLAFGEDLDCFLCSMDDIRAFAKLCQEEGVQYVGLCCGNAPTYTRVLAESFGRKPPASKYSPNFDSNYRTKPREGVRDEFRASLVAYTLQEID